MKNWLRAIALILCFTILGGLTTFAAENSILINISDGVEDQLKNIDITINPPEKGVIVTFKIKDSQNKIIVLEEKETDSEGKISYSYIHNSGDGDYMISAKRSDKKEVAEKSFTINSALSDQLLDDLKTAVDKKDYDATKTALTSIISSLNLNVTIYGENLPMDKITIIFADNVKTSDIKKLSDVASPFYESMLIELFENKDVKVSDILSQKELASALDLDNSLPKLNGKSVFETAEKDVQDKICASVKGTYKNVDEIRNAFSLQTLLKSLELGNWKSFEDLLKAYQEKKLINVSFKDFNKLTDEKQNIILQKLNNATFKSFGDVSKGINKLIADAGKKNPGGGSGGSGGGSGGSSGGSSSNIPIISGNKTPTIPQKPETDKKTVFTDLDDTRWAIEAIEYLHEKGIVSGKGDNKFEPKSSVTRAEFVKMIVELFDVPETIEAMPFYDVTQSDWSYDYVRRGYYAGIVTGRENGFFDKDATVSREEAAVILYRAIMKFEKNPPEVGLNIYVQFDDIDEASDWAKEEITYLLRVGIVRGKVLTNYVPKDLMNRAEAANMIYSYLKVVKGVA